MRGYITDRIHESRQDMSAMLDFGALLEARNRCVVCIDMTGCRGGSVSDLCDHYPDVPSADQPKIQEEHAVPGRNFCGLVGRALFKASA